MIIYKIEELTPNHYRCSALNNIKVLAYALYTINNNNTATGIGFTHTGNCIDLDIIKNLAIHVLQHLNSINIEYIINLPTKNTSILYLFANYFKNAIFYKDNGIIDKEQVINMIYDNCFNCSNINTTIKNGIISIIPTIDGGVDN